MVVYITVFLDIFSWGILNPIIPSVNAFLLVIIIIIIITIIVVIFVAAAASMF